MSRWVRTYERNGEYIESLDGVEWGAGRLPRRWHRCRPQTRAWMDGRHVERCNCGATRLDGNLPWVFRNETRISRRRQRREEAQPRITVACRTCGTDYEAAQGSSVAAERLCTTCWGKAFVAGARP